MRRDKSQVMNKVRGMWEGICVKWISKHFSLLIFLPILEDKKSGPKRENFLFYFSSLIKQWKTRFSILFSILLVFTPTKHTLRDYIRLSLLLWLLFLFSNNKMYADFIEKKNEIKLVLNGIFGFAIVLGFFINWTKKVNFFNLKKK